MATCKLLQTMNYLEEIIQEAIRRGDFKNLAGEGKPLKKIDDSPFGRETRMAYGLVKESGFTLAFIAERKLLSGEAETLREELRAAGRYLAGTPWGEIRWRRAVETFRHEAERLNKRILTYNLKAPKAQFHILPLEVEAEIAQIDGERP